MSGFVAQGTAVSDAGRVRGTNEDRVLLLDRAGPGASLYAVADGLGGHPQGYVASDLAVATLREEVPGLLAEGLPPREASPAPSRGPTGPSAAGPEARVPSPWRRPARRSSWRAAKRSSATWATRGPT